MTQLSSLFNTGKGSNYRFCDRGDPSGSYDWNTGDLTTDGNWYDLDCSSIVPSDATTIIFLVRIKDETTNLYFQMRKNGNSNNQNVGAARTLVANIQHEHEFIISCDENQVVEYRASNTTFTTLELTVKGWFIESGTSGGDVLSNASIGDNKLIRGDGGIKHIQECSTITVTDDGEMINTGQPAFNCSLTSTLSNCTGDGTVVQSTDLTWTENVDQGNDFSGGTFTAPVTGLYQLNIGVVLVDNTAAHTALRITMATSNRNYYLCYRDIGNCQVNGVYRETYSCLADMDANDTATFNITIFSSTKVVDVNEHTHWTGALIC